MGNCKIFAAIARIKDSAAAVVRLQDMKCAPSTEERRDRGKPARIRMSELAAEEESAERRTKTESGKLIESTNPGLNPSSAQISISGDVCFAGQDYGSPESFQFSAQTERSQAERPSWWRGSVVARWSTIVYRMQWKTETLLKKATKYIYPNFDWVWNPKCALKGWKSDRRSKQSTSVGRLSHSLPYQCVGAAMRWCACVHLAECACRGHLTTRTQCKWRWKVSGFMFPDGCRSTKRTWRKILCTSAYSNYLI